MPLTEDADALKDNGCEVTVTDAHDQVIYHNGWITDWPITEQNVAALAASARARWKIENENNNTLKTKGYHLEHNFGHGKKHLSCALRGRPRVGSTSSKSRRLRDPLSAPCRQGRNLVSRPARPLKIPELSSDAFAKPLTLPRSPLRESQIENCCI